MESVINSTPTELRADLASRECSLFHSRIYIRVRKVDPTERVPFVATQAVEVGSNPLIYVSLCDLYCRRYPVGDR